MRSEYSKQPHSEIQALRHLKTISFNLKQNIPVDPICVMSLSHVFGIWEDAELAGSGAGPSDPVWRLG